MARRGVITFFLTAVVFLLLGATGTYLAFSIPNDVQAEALLKQARAELKAGKRDGARTKFEEVVRSYPRTDAAAAASYALFRLLDQDRQELAQELAKVRGERDALQRRLGEIDQRVADASKKAEEAASRPIPEPPKPTVKPKPTQRRRTPPSRPTTRRRRG